MGRGLLDTSVFIAREQRRDLEFAALPDEGAISVVTLAELGADPSAAPRNARCRSVNFSGAPDRR
jgi:predicted nucleic acid-binding protein